MWKSHAWKPIQKYAKKLIYFKLLENYFGPYLCLWYYNTVVLRLVLKESLNKHIKLTYSY